MTGPVNIKRQGCKLLLDEAPLVILPSLARAIGLEATVVLQQLHFLIRLKSERHRAHPEERERDIHDGRVWVWNTYEQWHASYFGFLSVRSLQRIFLNLEKTGLILADKFNMSSLNKTKWYTINYDHPILKVPESTVTPEPDQSEDPPAECDDQRKSIVDGARTARSTCRIDAIEDATLASSNNNTKTTLTKRTTTKDQLLSSIIPRKFPIPATIEEAETIIKDVVDVIYPHGTGIKNRSKLIHVMKHKLMNGHLEVPDGWKETQKKKRESAQRDEQEKMNETDAQKARAKFNAMPDSEKKKYLDAARKKYGDIASDVSLQFVAAKLAMDERNNGSLCY